MIARNLVDEAETSAFSFEAAKKGTRDRLIAHTFPLEAGSPQCHNGVREKRDSFVARLHGSIPPPSGRSCREEAPTSRNC